MKTTTYKDDFGNSAIIVEMQIKPYNGATFTEIAFVLSCFDAEGFMHYRNTYPTIGDAIGKLKEFSCGTFAEMEAVA